MIIECLIKNGNGDPIGKIRISEDGTFTGSFSQTTPFVEVFGDVARAGMANGIILKPEFIPVVARYPRCQMGGIPVSINGVRESTHRESAIAQVKHPYGSRVYLCKSCLDTWLDDADENNEREPAELDFLNKRVA